MKPLNLDNSPCAPQSSNCVIWQGPNIPCIKLCTGDTISDVTYKLATELCTIMSELNLTNYDLACLNLVTSQPTTFNELIQLLINKICELENIPTSTSTGTGGCPDCVVSIASCFQANGQTTMQLLDYVTAIANRVCGLVSQISQFNAQISSLNTRVTALENEPAPTYTLPTFNPICVIGTVGPSTSPAPGIDTVLIQLINNTTNGYCALLTATGQPSAITTAIAAQCVSASATSLANPANSMLTEYPTWISSPTSLSDSFIDLWIALCDVRTAVAGLTAVDIVANSDTNSGITVTSAVLLGTETFTIASKTSVVEAGSGVTVTPVVSGFKTTYTVSADAFGSNSYSNTPSVNTKVIASSTVNVFSDGIPQALLTTIYTDSIGTWTAGTGTWRATVAGRYNIGFTLRMSFPSTGFTSGMVIVAAVNPGTGTVYASSTVTVNQATRFIELSGSALGTLLAVGNDVQLRVLNATDKDYAVVAGDIVSMTIQRVK
jgi:hypothetical protein